MGYAVARRGARRGRQRHAVSGPTQIPAPEVSISCACVGAGDARGGRVPRGGRRRRRHGRRVADYAPIRRPGRSPRTATIGAEDDRTPDILAELAPDAPPASGRGRCWSASPPRRATWWRAPGQATAQAGGPDRRQRRVRRRPRIRHRENAVTLIAADGEDELTLRPKADVARAISTGSSGCSPAAERHNAAAGGSNVAARAMANIDVSDRAGREGLQPRPGLGAPAGRSPGGSPFHPHRPGDCTLQALDARCRQSSSRRSPRAAHVHRRAPGRDEDIQGIHSSGGRGTVTKMVEAIGLRRGRSHCHVIKCRPPENRNPSRRSRLVRAVSLPPVESINPVVIVALGTFAAQALLRRRMHLPASRPRFATGARTSSRSSTRLPPAKPEKKRDAWRSQAGEEPSRRRAARRRRPALAYAPPRSVAVPVPALRRFDIPSP